MKKRSRYLLLIFSLTTIIFSSCGKRLNQRVTLWRSDKIPYGTYYAYYNLDYLFPNSDIDVNETSPEVLDVTSSAYIIISPTVKPSADELQAIFNLAVAGNHIFISGLEIGKNLLDSFSLKEKNNFPLRSDSTTLVIYDPEVGDSVKFQYPGFRLESSFGGMDTTITNIVGRDENGDANFVRFTYQGGGSVSIHYAPVGFTNFFLLHKQNKKYYDLAMSVIPDTVSTVIWDDYFRRHADGKDIGQKSGFSKLSMFMNDEVLKWAFWLTIILFAIVYLFESKRKQRIIPPVAALKNASLDFVKTVGRLYYQRKDNKNLASKMITQFLGTIRTRFNLPTAELSDEFVDKLAFKSGYAKTLVRDIVDDIKKMDEAQVVTDEELLAFNDKMDRFIKG